MKQLTPAAKAVLRVISLSWFAGSLAGIFVDLFIFRQTGQFQSLVVYNGFIFLFLLIIYALSGYWLRHYSARTLVKLGNGLAVIFFGLIVILQHRSIDWLIPLAILKGISAGLFWSGINLHQYLTTYNQDRDYYFGVQEFWLNLSRIAAPFLGGLIITLGNFLTRQPLTGYYLLFMITGVIIAIATIETWSLPRFSGIDFKLGQLRHILTRNPPIKQIFWQQTLMGWRDVSSMTLISIIIFLVLRQELTIGFYNSVMGLVMAGAGVMFAKILTAQNRVRWSLIGAVGLSLGLIVIGLWPNFPGLIISSLVGIPGTALAITLSTIFYDVADVDRAHWRLKYAYLLGRDVALGSARVISYLMLWWLLTVLPQLTVARWWLIFLSLLPIMTWFSVKKVAAYVYKD